MMITGDVSSLRKYKSELSANEQAGKQAQPADRHAGGAQLTFFERKTGIIPLPLYLDLFSLLTWRYISSTTGCFVRLFSNSNKQTANS